MSRSQVERLMRLSEEDKNMVRSVARSRVRVPGAFYTYFKSAVQPAAGGFDTVTDNTKLAHFRACGKDNRTR